MRISTLQPGRQHPDRADHADEGARPVVGQVVAVDRGDDGVAQPHRLHLVGDAQRLQRVVPGRLAGLHVAEAAAAGADVAEDHEGRGAALPALADVGAVGLLADGVEVVGADRRLQPPVVGPARRRHFQPRRLAGALEGDGAVGRGRGAARLGAGAGDVDALGGAAGAVAGPARLCSARSSRSSGRPSVAGGRSRPRSAGSVGDGSALEDLAEAARRRCRRRRRGPARRRARARARSSPRPRSRRARSTRTAAGRC